MEHVSKRGRKYGSPIQLGTESYNAYVKAVSDLCKAQKALGWNPNVENHFDGILSQLQQENVTASEGSSRAKPENTAEKVVNMDTSRTCSVQLSTIFREDLPEDISQYFKRH
ncbi:hypothetical protein HPULCUR_004897 [Helicostylum pulchrum]|uniref:Uncharacterized protein n=1 Tax=Helicostylum pulchrum TaxID=562976 RepID=A0ABP9XXN5_9FUNG